MQLLYDRYFDDDWQLRMGDPEVWQKIYSVDPGELWETHNALKSLLIEFVRRRISRQCRRRTEPEDVIDAANRRGTARA
jgi:starch phosphorylase